MCKRKVQDLHELKLEESNSTQSSKTTGGLICKNNPHKKHTTRTLPAIRVYNIDTTAAQQTPQSYHNNKPR
jgi:hypothetical protein